jgi:hypothetical protein
LTPAIARLKQQLADPAQLVSLDRVYHRFAYEYGTPIRQIAWPAAAADVPSHGDYFCFDNRPNDLNQIRALSALPFEWDVMTEIYCDPAHRDVPVRTVVVGRVRRAHMLAQPSVIRPVLR